LFGLATDIYILFKDYLKYDYCFMDLQVKRCYDLISACGLTNAKYFSEQKNMTLL